MPLKNKSKGTVQTKLSFKPISASKPQVAALFTTETTAPLRPHMSILNQTQQDNLPKAAIVSATMLSSLSSKQQGSAYSLGVSSGGSFPKRDVNIGGNSRKATTGEDTFSTRELASSIPSSESSVVSSSVSSTQVFQSTTVNGTTYDYIPGCSPSENHLGLDPKGLHTATATDQSEESRKRKSTSDPDRYHSNGASSTSPVELDSDSENDHRSGFKASSQLHSHSSSTLKRQSSSSSLKMPGSLPTASSAPKLSLLEQMATPRGTQPLPRTAELLGSRGSGVQGRTYSRPPLISSNSQVSDDGFTSGASLLDSMMYGSIASQEPEVAPPLFQGSQNGGIQYSKPAYSRSSSSSSIQAKVQSYSQKRAGDFATFSVGATKKRILPPTITGYQPNTGVQPGFRGGSSNVSMSALRSRSSSPASLTSSSEIKYSQERTKDGILLSDEQQHVLKQVMDRHMSIFFTGSAGTGKSVLLRELIFRLRNKYSSKGNRDFWESTNDAVAVTASTGIAACNIGGCTLHSFAGVGLGQEGLPVLQAKVRKNNTTMRRWQDTKVLIIDEVSMIDAEFMDKLEALARTIRKNESPWGGIQVVLTGDFFQLPPVNKSGKVKFCFEGESWSRSIEKTIQLRQVFRQKDQTFADMLNEMRLGQMSMTTIQRFQTLTRELRVDDGLRPTELFPLRNQVEEANNRMLNNLPGKTYVFHAKDRGPMKEKMEQNCLASTILHLKINAQVMLLRNQGGGSGGLVNGSLGILVGFVAKPADNENVMGSDGQRKGSLNTPGEELPLVRFTLEGGVTREMVVGREEWKIELPNGDLQAARVQIPLGLAWSLSIHKSQGQTLPKVRVDLGRVFEKGQAYVALSRATNLDGLQVLNFDPRKVMVHPKVTEFYKNLRVYVKGDDKCKEDDQKS